MADLPLLHATATSGAKTALRCNNAGRLAIDALDNNYDTFNRLKAGAPATIFAAKQLFDALPLFFDNQEVSGAGTGTSYNVNRGSSYLTVGNATAGERVMQSKVRGVYHPGVSFEVYLTAVVGTAAAGITKRWGYFDQFNGLFYQLTNSGFAVVVRSYVTGAAVDEVVYQESFNTDPLDGTGESGITIDLTKSQLFFIEFAWLGVGQVRFGINVNGVNIVMHTVQNANDRTSVYMTRANLPIRYSIANSGAGPADTLEAICASMVTNGQQNQTESMHYVSRGGTPITLANQDLYTPIISVRTNPSKIGATLKVVVVSCVLTTSTNFEWRLYLNPTIGGVDAVSWQTLANSAIQYDVSRDVTNLCTGGTVIQGGYGANQGAARSIISSALTTQLQLGSNIDGTTDEIVLAVANIDANGGTAYGGLELTETV